MIKKTAETKMIKPFYGAYFLTESLQKFVILLFSLFFMLIDRLFKDKKQEIWLIGENRGECLKENGYWFYQYCRKNCLSDHVYFVIKDFSPFYNREMIDDPFVLSFGSLQHARMFSKSTVCFYTHTYKDVMYRRIFNLFGNKKKLVYLHHGVLGFKKFNPFYQKYRNSMDLFTVGSNFEKELLINQAGVQEQKVKVTGYARYDGLKNSLSDSQLQIVYIPTHRNYIKTDFTDSLFFRRVNSLLRNKQLSALLNNNNIILKVYFHKEFQKYSDKITGLSSDIKIIKLGEETPQQLISESHLMITDYSSVSWDFFYLGKPVLFYRFDVEEYLHDRDSYIDLNDNIIGEVISNEDLLIPTISKYISNQFQMEKNNNLFRNKILPNIDQQNCKRIYNNVKELNY